MTLLFFQNDLLKTVCRFGSTVKNSQLTDINHYIYLPLKCSYSSRRVNNTILLFTSHRQ